MAIGEEVNTKQIWAGFTLGILASFIANVIFHQISSESQPPAARWVETHIHGEHTCYCPACGYEIVIDAYVQCGTQICPQCGSRMRALETGEYRL